MSGRALVYSRTIQGFWVFFPSPVLLIGAGVEVVRELDVTRMGFTRSRELRVPVRE